MNTAAVYGNAAWRISDDARRGAYVVSPIAPPSHLTRAAAKPAAVGMSASAIHRHHAAAAPVASVNRGYI